VGAGRKPHNPPLKKRCVCVTDAQAKLLRMYGRGDLSAGLRWLVDVTAGKVRRLQHDSYDVVNHPPPPTP
jgi:hypothetical protein